MKGYSAVIEYGVGNLLSVTKTLKFIGVENVITDDPGVIEKANSIILPGVGAFPAAAENLRGRGLDKVIVEQARKKPILGICLGMQLLFDAGYEIRETPGLGLVPGVVRKIETKLKLPHIGWNSLDIRRASPLLDGIEGGSYVYFVHTFCGVAKNKDDLIATADYDEDVAAVVGCGNVYGCQFHPEKSGDVGLEILKNFAKLMG